MKILKKVFSDWLIGLLVAVPVIAGFFLEWGPFSALEAKTYDFRAKLRQKKAAPTAPIVIVAIDDQSLSTLGRWPWPRSYMADMITRLSEYGAKTIGVNVLYSEPDRNTGLDEIRGIKKRLEEMPGLERNRQLAEIYDALLKAEENIDNDAALSSAISASGRVVLPVVFTLGEDVGKGEGELPDYLKANSTESAGGAATAVSVTPPIAEFAGGAQGLGHVNLIEDSDGTVRKETLLMKYRARLYPSFSLQLALRHLGYGVSEVNASRGISVGALSVPTDDQGSMLISFNGRQGTFPYYSFYDVAMEKVPLDVFKDKIVLIGHTGTGNVALSVTPVQHGFPTVEIQANAIENLLNKNFISRPLWARWLEPSVLVFFAVFVSLIMPRFRAGGSALITAALLLLWNGASVYLFASKGYWLQMSLPNLLLGLGYTLIMSKRYLVTERAKEVVEADSIETNKMLGLSFQGQGMLDMAFEKFRKCPVEDESVKELLYNLGLDFERKRQFNKSVSVFEHILSDGKFKDIEERIKQLRAAGETMIFGAPAGRKDSTIIVEGAKTLPTLGRYEIVKELGRGAMGTVFLGKDPKINRMVAIKTVRFEELDEAQVPEAKIRFFREAEAAGKLSHPNIVTIYDAGEEYDVAYVAMELLEGIDLVKFCSKENRLSAKKVLWVIGSVASALDYAHRNGIVHRDIKPANIMLLKKNVIKVTDFGIARVMSSSKTQTGVILGTPSYMSPEQVMGKKVDGRSDLFSLGVVFFELLTGDKPFAGDSIGTLMYNIANTPPPDVKGIMPDAPGCCVAILEKMLVKEVEGRYQRGAEIVTDIKACMQEAV